MRRLRTVLLGLVPALLALLGIVALLAPPASSVRGLATSALAPGAAITTVAHADVVSVALAALLVAVVFLTFAAIANPARARYLVAHAVPRRHVSTYGVELAGQSYPELAVWRQWGRRVWDHRTYRLHAAVSATT